MAGGLVLFIVSVLLLGLCIIISLSKQQWESHFPTVARLIDYFPATLIGSGLGLVMIVTGLCYGLFSVSTQNNGPRQTQVYFRVLSRYCLDKDFNLLISDTDIEFANKPKFYIRGMLNNGDVGEFQTTIEVFFNAGEGMYGEAEIQGAWLGKFIPYIGEPGDGAKNLDA